MTRLRAGASLLSGVVCVGATLYAATASAEEPATTTGTPPPAAQPVTSYAPPKLAWDKGDPVPPGYTPSTEIREGFVIAGAVTLGVSWVFGGVIPGIGLLAACSAANSGGVQTGSCAPAGGVLLIPGIGPFLAMAAVATTGANAGVGYAILAIDGAVQSAGAVLLIYGLASQRDVLIRNDKLKTSVLKWIPMPMAVGTGHGLGLVGTF
jgi:hypothetical protein